MRYAEIILPLPIEGTFTYAVPLSMSSDMAVGKRVVVPLGRSKTYVGIVLRLHDTQPGFVVRDILQVLDTRPVVLPNQLRLWQWISQYYMSPLGDVYKAALPAYLKNEKNSRPKTEQCVGLCESYRDKASLHAAIELLARAGKQQHTFQTFLSLSHWDTAADELYDGKDGCAVQEVTREELMNESRCSSQVLKSLIDRNLLFLYEREKKEQPLPDVSPVVPVKTLTEAQQTAFKQIESEFQAKDVVLLKGVTSSGKTEVYIHLIKKAIAENKQVLYLLPEIALTVQIMVRLRSVFGQRLGIYHSRCTDEERLKIWNKQVSDSPYDVILGVRSSVFLPFQRLGLVIIDEEHDTSFKQQEPAPRYHARSAAIVLAAMCKAKTLLGTATPSIETYYNVQRGKYGVALLTKRYKDIEMPQIQVVDTKDLRRRKMMRDVFSPQLLSSMRAAIDSGQQVILFQNRRGYVPMIECKDCGWVPKCRNCDVSLTYHKRTNILSCHYCGAAYSIPSVCPECGGHYLQGRGYGTEKIEDLVAGLFPDAKVARMDFDTTRTHNAYERIINDFSSGKTNVLIGTQMISKGLDFDHVGVVAILDADNMLNYPDFRAYENAFMMMMQVSGRAGRKGKRGLVILQTRNATLPLISNVVENDDEQFYKNMLEERKLFNYPPFCRLIYIYLKHSNRSLVEEAAMRFSQRLRANLGDSVLGPDSPGVSMVKSKSIQRIMIKVRNTLSASKIRDFLRAEEKSLMQDKRYSTLQIYYDVDPM